MPTVEFLPFAIGAGANVESQASWAGDSVVTDGFSTGLAPSAKCNKAWRQGSFMAAVIANFISNVLGQSVLDDGDLSGKVTALGNAIQLKGGFTPGTALLFPQATAPTGWAQDTSVNDRVLRVVSGTGGGVGGSWVIAGLTNGDTGFHSLTIAEMPPHNHVQGEPNSGGGSYYGMTTPPGATTGPSDRDGLTGGLVDGQSYITSTTGGGGAHNHPGSAITADGSWRPAYYNVIRAIKS